jgi:hypothetical protein
LNFGEISGKIMNGIICASIICDDDLVICGVVTNTWKEVFKVFFTVEIEDDNC